ncbi:uncharacterized protein LOC109605417 isoform X2 [Aethina tumida]|uniref:uncharacterized protein LOC109605417 isoform X2 n=1 Tax=Aethina tumida TaxID=116153 RepID=UPI0021476F5B|nr:uncharacterized protein LOC109605417 isoform X2 [Aethina tumida]
MSINIREKNRIDAVLKFAHLWEEGIDSLCWRQGKVLKSLDTNEFFKLDDIVIVYQHDGILCSSDNNTGILKCYVIYKDGLTYIDNTNEFYSRILKKRIDQIQLYMHFSGKMDGIYFEINATTGKWGILKIDYNLERIKFLINFIHKEFSGTKDSITVVKILDKLYPDLQFDEFGTM